MGASAEREEDSLLHEFVEPLCENTKHKLKEKYLFFEVYLYHYLIFFIVNTILKIIISRKSKYLKWTDFSSFKEERKTELN